jgi:anthranilate synthase component 2
LILILDNFDSFTYNLVDYFSQLGVESRILRNNVSVSLITKYDYEGIVLSPGPETPDKAGCLMEIIDIYHDVIPILGICLGHQAIGQYFGSSLKMGQKPMHGKISTVLVEDDYIFKGLDTSIQVVRYHSLILDKISEPLSVIAQTESGEVMAIKHNQLPIRGFQFHPEAVLTTTGFEMLKNWILFNNIVHQNLNY